MARASTRVDRSLRKKQPSDLYLSRRTSARRGDRESVAVGRRLRVSPIKLNLVVDLIRGCSVDRALANLQFSNKRVAHDVRKVLLSAVANAENNHELNIDRLWVREALVGRGTLMKRYRPRAKGRAGPILKPFSHVRIVLVESDGLASS